MPPRHIAVLGAGLTGLSSAFHLSRRFPQTLITLVEKQPRVGGWVRSERVQVTDEDGTPTSVLLESGPRTLRPNAKSVLELVDLHSEVITTPKSSPAAKSRFLKLHPNTLGVATTHTKTRDGINGNGGLTEIPSTPLALLTSPLRFLFLKSILFEPFKWSNRPPPISGSTLTAKDHDESFHAFLARRFGPAFATTLGSSLIHGIYAADSRKLSVRAAFPIMLELEERGWGSLVRGVASSVLRSVFGRRKRADENEYELGNVKELVKDAAVFSFRDGMETLPRALEAYLRERDNVRIVLDTGVTSIRPSASESEGNSEDTFDVVLDSGETITATHIVSTIAPPVLSRLLPSSSSSSQESSLPAIPHLTANPYSTVTVINLIFPCSPDKIHPPGFGYLVPRPPGDYPSLSSSPALLSPLAREEKNAVAASSELGTSIGVLGTVFDSCSLSSQDEPSGAKVTKLTLMTGGPYPDFLPPGVFSSPGPSAARDTTGDERCGIASGHIPPLSSKSAHPWANVPPFLHPVLSHLSSTLLPHTSPVRLPAPVYYKITRNVECIPTLLPGHLNRVKEMQMALLSDDRQGRGWNGRLEVLGAGVGGVSVGDCVEAGRRVGEQW
ncbi:hypothetical protein AX16_007756 [Volvariella volvacea WC 439]|nr:hypothetical protein AX16_007756 [Volvariella volvacea WC 439]